MERKSRKSSSSKDGGTIDKSTKDKVAEGDTSIVEQSSVENRDSTQTILEDVCMDFESIDVINPKSYKASVVKKEKDSSVADKKDPKDDSSTGIIEEASSLSNKSSANEDQNFSDKDREPPCNYESNETNSQFTITSIPESVQQCDAPILRCEIQSDTDTMPSNSSDIPVLVQEDFDETNIPLAELADAEIVQSGDKVSIIVTNSRLIKVLTQASNSDNSVQSVMEPTNIILETNVGSSNSLGILDPDILLNSTIQDIMADTSIVNETVISGGMTDYEPHLTKNQLNISLKKSPNPRGRQPVKKAGKQSYSEPGGITKARRVTAKMKNEWARQLEADGHLVCQMPGCLQTYVTVANFQTHYKYCTGKKRLQHCLYCDSLIFSSHRAVLHHMQVEHPEKVEEYKAKYPEAIEELEEVGGLPSHLIVAEDENVAINEEVTHQPLKNVRKRKLSAKENVASKKRCILKHKMQTIQNKVTENIKEFKKCVRFTDIVDKINSVDVANSFELPSSPQKKVTKPKKEKREPIYFTESIIAEKKYFEDDEDDPANISGEQSDGMPENTKARVLLNMERYKRYKEYLKLTRDWSSERRTYSRSRSAETSFDSSYLMALQNEYMQDALQLNDSAELSSISLNTFEAEVNQQEPDLEIFVPDPMPTPVVTPQDVIVNESINAAVCRVTGSHYEVSSRYPSRLEEEAQNASSSQKSPSATSSTASAEKNYAYARVARGGRTLCYNRPSLPIELNSLSLPIASNCQSLPAVPIKIEGVKSKPKYDNVITYGLNPPDQANQPVEPPVTFDSLINSTQEKQDKISTLEKGADTQIDVQNSSQKESAKDTVIVDKSEPPKKKRGRPSKPKLETTEQIKGANEPKNINTNVGRKNAKIYGKAMLKSIEKNVKNRHSKLFKKSSKYKKNSKLTQKQQQQLQKLKTIQKNKLKQKMLAKSKSNQKNAKNSFTAVNTIISNQEKLIKATPTAESSIIQCEGNTENHIDSNVQSFVTENSYSNIINSVIEDQLIADANNVATEIEIVTSSVENNAAPCDINTSEMNEKVEEVSSQVALPESSEDHIKESLENISPTAESTPKPNNLDHSEINAVVENNTDNASVSPEKTNSEESRNIENATPGAVLNAGNKSAPQETEISESNLSLEITTPEVKAKRGRGRPRKNQSNTQTPDTPVASSSVSNASKTEEKDKTKKSDENKETQSESETPVSVRKSERVKRRKVADDEIFETPKVEAKKKEEDTVQVIRTGRRGRPRKVVNEPEVNQEEQKESKEQEESVENTPEVESSLADENLRKFSRKGRPRKCVRYADLNSGVDSSESLDGMNASAKNKAEVSKTQQKNRKSQELEEKDDKVENNTTQEIEETIVLPLKKRKQRQARKDDSGVKQTDEKSKDADSEIVLEEKDEEKEEIELENEKDEEKESKSAKGSRKRKRVRHDSSDMEAELESLISQSKKRQKYSAPVTRRKATVVEIEETSDAEKIEDRATSQKDLSKKLIDSPTVNRKYSARSIARSKALKCASLNNSLESSVVVLPDFKPSKEAWKLLTGKNYYDFLPPMKFSPFFKTEKTWKESGSDWSSLRVFDSASLDKDSCHITFFTGGPVMSSAWCPTPVENKVQYIALAISCSLDKHHFYSNTNSKRGLLQLWSVGPLRDKIPESKPTIELCIAHEYGVITEMTWCPHGCWEDPASECSKDHLPRLGMLATACSDSFIRIYSIPQPSVVNTESSFPMYDSCPSIVLEPLFGETCSATKKSVCLSLSWQRHGNCERIAGGYGNGMICVWHINTSATILVSKEKNPVKIRPYLVFSAHGTPVTSVSFAKIPGGRYLVSSSIDRTLKFWDLVDISLPFFTVKKGAARCAEWSAHYCGAFVSLDYGMNCFKGSSYFKECGTEIYSPRNLSPPSISVTRTTVSEFLNAQAITEIAGSVSVSFINSLLQEHVRSPYFHRPVYLTKMAEVEGIDEKIASLCYPESVTCMETVQEIKEVISIMDKITQKDFLPEPLETNSVELNEHSSEWPDCESTVQRMGDTVTVVTDLVQKCENSALLDQNLVTSDDPELDSIEECCRNEVEDLVILNDKLSEMKDLVTAVMDMNDVASTVDHLRLNSDEIPSAREKIPSLKAVADNSLKPFLIEVDEKSKINQSCENIQVEVSEESNSSTEVLKTLINSVTILLNDADNSLKDSSGFEIVEDYVDSSTEVLKTLINSVTILLNGADNSSKNDSGFENVEDSVDSSTEVLKTLINSVTILLGDADYSSKDSSGFENVEDCVDSSTEVLKTLINSVSILLTDADNSLNDSSGFENVQDNQKGIAQNVLDSSQGSVKDLCSESVACISTLHDNVSCISALHENVACISALHENVACIAALHENVECISALHENVECISTLHENVECISTLDEIGAVVAVINDITDRCPKVETLDACSDPHEATTCEDLETHSEKIKDFEETFVKDAEKDPSVATVDSVIQRMKEVVSVVSHIIKRSSNELNEFEMKILVTEYLTEIFRKQKILNVSEEIHNGKWLIQGTGTPFDFSGLTDIVGTVMDLRDVTVTIEHLVNSGQGIDSFANQVPSYLSELIYGNIKSQPKSFIDFQTEPTVEVLPNFASPKSTLSSDVCDEISVQLETATALHVIVETVCEKLKTEAEINNLLSDIVSEVEIKSLLNEMVSEAEVESLLCEMVSEIQKVELECKLSLLPFTTEDNSGSKCVTVAESDEDFPMTDVTSEPVFIDVSSGSSVSDKTKEECNNAVPPSENFDLIQPLKLEEDELMLLDGESSNSENDSDSDDGMYVADSYIFEEKNAFSDDSFMSECSLDSNISMCSYSGLSDISENSYDAVPSEQGLVNSTSCSDLQNSVADESQMPVEHSQSSLKVVPDSLQDSSSHHAKDSLENDSGITSSHQKCQEAEIHPDQIEMNLTEEIVPNTSCQETDIQPGNQKSISDEIDVLDISVNDIVVDDLSSKPVCNMSGHSEVEIVPVSNEGSLADVVPQTNGILTDDKICDKSSRTETSENLTDISCTENTEESSPVCTDNCLKITSDSDCSVLPQTMQKDIFDLEKVPQTVVNNESNEDSILLEPIPVVHKKTSSPERMSYENVISQYGLVFKDMNTAQFESIEDIQTEGEDSLDQYHLASIKTISWNPNFGTHYWLFSAGQSGLARISYISDINESEVSNTKDGRDT